MRERPGLELKLLWLPKDDDAYLVELGQDCPIAPDYVRNGSAENIASS